MVKRPTKIDRLREMGMLNPQPERVRAPWFEVAGFFDADDLRFTRDPFDGLIVASALDLGLGLITRDSAIREAGVVKTIW